ncbi:penicillin-binding protein 2 [Vibrio ponticus]|nr:penicillin-binding protein 2 [Vibrio ponticus]
MVNHGKVIAPHLLRATIENGAEFNTNSMAEIVTYPPIDNVKERYWDIAIEGMRLVNHGRKGTARRAFADAKYVTAGKSGTAQVFGLGEDEEYNADEIAEHLRDHALYTGFAPLDDPQLVVTVVLENAGGGSSNGAPVARRVFDHVLLEKNIVKNKEE